MREFVGMKTPLTLCFQECTRYSVELPEDPQQEAMEELAGHLGLTMVGQGQVLVHISARHAVPLMQIGWIFTDLEPEGMKGKVAYKRSIVRPNRSTRAGLVAHLSVCAPSVPAAHSSPQC